MSCLVPAEYHRTLRSVGKAETQLRGHPAPHRDLMSPLLSKELEADPALASKSRSRSYITSVPGNLSPALCWQGAGDRLLLRIFMQSQ